MTTIGVGRDLAHVARVTLKTIAERAGVSRMTVSNAFSRPQLLTDEMRTRVLAAADELGYVGPDPAARALARGTTGSVGLLLTDSLPEALSDAVATAFLASVAHALTESGLSLTLLTPAGVDGVIPARDVAVDGVLVYVCHPDSPDVRWVQRRRLPMVTIDHEPFPGTAHINVDDRGGARAAAQHLLELGHRRIAILSLGEGTPHGLVADPTEYRTVFSADERLTGWLEALSPAGVTPAVLLEPFRPQSDAYDAVRLLLQQPQRPTAILCFADVYAQTVVRAANDLGLRIPQDLSVVGFDDSPVAIQTTPQLTTVRQDITEKGAAAVRALTSVMQARRAGTREPTEHIVLPTELVVRDSTAPPPPLPKSQKKVRTKSTTR